MADNRGGYRRPEQPAPVSGPGKLSRRTDGGPFQPQQDLPNAAYGEQKDFQNIQQGAPMAGGGGQEDMPPPLSAPTMFPNEPITSGADAGPGIGSEAAGIQTDLSKADIQNLKGFVYSLEMAANQPGTNPSTLALVRALKAKM